MREDYELGTCMGCGGYQDECVCGRTMMSAPDGTRLATYIATSERRGVGTVGDPVRMCRQLFTRDGRLVADYDPHLQTSWFRP